MESSHLLNFFNQVKIKPITETEVDSLSEKIMDLLEVPFVMAFLIGGLEGVGIKSLSHGSMEEIPRHRLGDFLKAQFKDSKSQNGAIDLRRIQFKSEGSSVWQFLSSVKYLTSFKISEVTSLSKKDYGDLIVGSEKPLTLVQELAGSAACQHIAGLARAAELEGEVQARNQFLSIASHELKTPLTSIYGILQLQERMLRLNRDEKTFPEQERHHNFIKMVIRQVERLTELIDGLLDVSRIQNNRFMVEPTETDVASLLRDCTQSRLHIISQEAGTRLNVDSPAALVACVDPVRMEEVINNIVMNAIRFSPEGGVVWIRLREENGSFRLTVRDQGPSIPIEDRERIFKPFERAQRTTRMGGMGLGLFISRQIAQLHGGNVSLVESVPGKGNVFEAYFPIRAAQVTAE